MIIYIVIACYFIYKSGVVKLLLKAARLEETPQELPQQMQQTTRSSTAAPPSLERRQLETIAASILLYNGYKYNAFSLVKRLNTEELQNIITRFKDDLNI